MDIALVSEEYRVLVAAVVNEMINNDLPQRLGLHALFQLSIHRHLKAVPMALGGGIQIDSLDELCLTSVEIKLEYQELSRL